MDAASTFSNRNSQIPLEAEENEATVTKAGMRFSLHQAQMVEVFERIGAAEEER